MKLMKLQINTSGAWRNVVAFSEYRRDAVVRELRGLAEVLGLDDVKWCLVHDDGKREWLKFTETTP